MAKDQSNRLLELYLPPAPNFRLQSLVATTYQLDFAFLEEDLLPVSLGVRSPLSRLRAFRLELERELQNTEVSVLYDIRTGKVTGRLSPRIDPILLRSRKQHAKISLLLWMRPAFESSPAETIVRLILGSANLTRQGYRENYECVTQLDFSPNHESPRVLLEEAISLIRQIAADRISPQLQRQLDAFSRFATGLPRRADAEIAPRALVTAETAIPTIARLWTQAKADSPDKLTIASPFWPQGEGAAEVLKGLIDQLHSPTEVELVTRGAAAPAGNRWLPEFQATLAAELKTLYPGKLSLRPALPNLDAAGVDSTETEEDEAGELLEDEVLGRERLGTAETNQDVYRALHAKLLILQNRNHIVLYTGSSNCTRRGLGLGGPANWEAGFVYSLPRKYRKQVEALYEFAGPPVEVLPDQLPRTLEPMEAEATALFPYFIRDITATGTEVTVEFEQAIELPTDLLILMDVSGTGMGGDYRQIYPLIEQHLQAQQIVSELVTDGPPPEPATTDAALSSESSETASTLRAELAPEIPTIESTEPVLSGEQGFFQLESNLPAEAISSERSDSVATTGTTPPTISDDSAVSITVKLQDCPRWEPSQNRSTNSLDELSIKSAVTPNVHAEIRWAGYSYEYPVRFDDKATLPIILRGRKPTESELIEFFLSGREPAAFFEELQFVEAEDHATGNRETPIDTRGILSYFVRRFVHALPGVESQVKRAAYSRPALDSALRGPTSPLALAHRAFESLTKQPPAGEPRKTATAVGFQLVELLAALRRCRDDIAQPDFKELFTPVLAEIREFLASVVRNSPELQSPSFTQYRTEFMEAGQ
jgi:hypothetical protein